MALMCRDRKTPLKIQLWGSKNLRSIFQVLFWFLYKAMLNTPYMPHTERWINDYLWKWQSHYIKCIYVNSASSYTNINFVQNSSTKQIKLLPIFQWLSSLQLSHFRSTPCILYSLIIWVHNSWLIMIIVIFGFKVKFNQHNLWNNVKITDLPFILRKSNIEVTQRNL